MIACKPKDHHAIPIADEFNVPEVADVVMYQVNPRVFAPSNSFQAIISRLDSIQDLGVNMLWIMPIYPIGKVKSKNSPYSISDYKLGEVFNATEFITESNEKLLINGEETDKENYDTLLAQNTPGEFETAGRNMFELKSEYVLPVIEGNTDGIEAQEIESTTEEESETVDESIPGESESAADESGTEISDENAIDYTSEVLQ